MSRTSGNTDRHHGGPGSSDQNRDKPKQEASGAPHPGEPTNPDRSRVSSGGGERDVRHTHDPMTKS